MHVKIAISDAIPECDSEMFSGPFLEEIPVGARDIHETMKVGFILLLVLKYAVDGWLGCLDQSHAR